MDMMAAAVATTSDLAHHIVEMRGAWDNVFVVPHGIPVTEPGPSIFHDPPVIGAMGRIVAKKGFNIFCKSLAILKSQSVPFRALIAGEGDERQWLERDIHMLNLDADVSLLGWIESRDAKNSFWQNIDIFCLPSLHEPFGIVLLEAWAAGRPVVTTDTEGPSWIVAPEVDAVIVPKGDAEALAKSLRSLLENPERACALARSGHAKVLTHYTIAALADRLKVVVNEVLKRRT
jgi:glycosyltransferase involved in cell wall biosynthesis